ncbi:hypothetical protein [Sulfitobacter sp. JB4-11]|uniref:hypothetical protein n=1 Tax=Sulfitobacter rhodophyticola TaxID=3238304 RepID=UPI003514AF95
MQNADPMQQAMFWRRMALYLMAQRNGQGGAGWPGQGGGAAAGGGQFGGQNPGGGAGQWRR